MKAIVTRTDHEIYAKRHALQCGVDGGMPLNMTLPAMCYTRNVAVSLLPSPRTEFGVAAIGMGDGVMLALFETCTLCSSVGGVELVLHGLDDPEITFSSMSALIHRETPAKRYLYWQKDVKSLTTVASSLAPSSSFIIAYGFDDSIELSARKHWYGLLEAEVLVGIICTTWHAGLEIGRLLPSFVIRAKFRVNLEGGNCSRTMLILTRVSELF